MNIKAVTVFSVVVAVVMFMGRAEVNGQGAMINWQGDGGHRVRITMTYDPSLALVYARGDARPSITATNFGITSLSVQFFPPSSSTPLYSTDNVVNGIVSYRFLMIYFDTVSGVLTGALDVGRDSFAEGGGSSLGEYHLNGLVSSPLLINSFTTQIMDSGGQFTVTIVPEPSTCAFAAIGFAIVAFARRSRVHHNRKIFLP